MKVLLIDNYDSFTYNLYHYLSHLGCKVDVIRNDKVNSKDVIKNKYKKIVISPGPGNPDQTGNCLKIVKDLHKKIPILGTGVAKPGLIRTTDIMISIRFLRTQTTSFQITVMPLALEELA